MSLSSLSHASRTSCARHAIHRVLGDVQVTRRRLRWIAVQAIVVTALAVVVTLTLLKPESNSPLNGISGSGVHPPLAQTDGPGGGGGGTNGGGHNGGGRGNGHGGGRGTNQTGGHGASDAPTGTASTSAGGSPPSASTVAPDSSSIRPEGGYPGESPTSDQYADTLGAIDSALR